MDQPQFYALFSSSLRVAKGMSQAAIRLLRVLQQGLDTQGTENFRGGYSNEIE